MTSLRGCDQHLLTAFTIEPQLPEVNRLQMEIQAETLIWYSTRENTSRVPETTVNAKCLRHVGVLISVSFENGISRATAGQMCFDNFTND